METFAGTCISFEEPSCKEFLDYVTSGDERHRQNQTKLIGDMLLINNLLLLGIILAVAIRAIINKHNTKKRN